MKETFLSSPMESTCPISIYSYENDKFSLKGNLNVAYAYLGNVR